MLTTCDIFDIIIKLNATNEMRVCWNWQTGTFEGRVLRRTGSSPVTRTTSSNRRKHRRWTGG